MLCTVGEFKSAMRQFPAGVAVIATGVAPSRFGMTATAVCSLTADPPQVLVCLNAQTATSEAIRKNGTFSMNLLSDAQAHTARRFAGMDGVSGDAKFDPAEWDAKPSGPPILNTSLNSFACRVVSAHKEGTHFIIVGQVEEIQKSDCEQALIYRDGAFGHFTLLPSTQKDVSA